MELAYLKITAEETRSLRHKILRPNQDISATIYPMDEHKESLHFAALKDNKIIGVISAYPMDQDEIYIQSQYRIRGMAVLAEFQGQGIGSQLINITIKEIKSQNQAVKVIWCNARTSAAGFYQKLGFAKQGEEFEINGIGPHYKYFCSL